MGSRSIASASAAFSRTREWIRYAWVADERIALAPRDSYEHGADSVTLGQCARALEESAQVARITSVLE